MKALRLDSNNLPRMDNLFQDLNDLSWLNVSANSISVFDYAMLPRGLTWLDLHQNAIALLGKDAENICRTHINYFCILKKIEYFAKVDLLSVIVVFITNEYKQVL